VRTGVIDAGTFDDDPEPELEPAIGPKEEAAAEPEPAIEPEPEPQPDPGPVKTSLLALCVKVLHAAFPDGRPSALTVDELRTKVLLALKASGTQREISKSTVERAIARLWG
jgi:hypothetical protein